MNYQIELLHSLLNEFLTGESALMTLDGDVLAVRGQQPVTYGTLAAAATTAAKYLKLEEGDIALLNDPYSGGSLLSEMTFIMAVSEDLLWITRRPLDTQVKIVKSIEEEGLRIPPTPLRQKNQLNEMIMAAMQAHPACPPDFATWLKAQVAELTVSAKKLVDAIELTGFTITGELIEDYLRISKKSATKKVSESASGEARVDVVLDSGELLRLNMEIHDGKISLDFSGTTAVKTVSLTESATYGACFHALSQYYGFTDLANSGSFSVLQITKPSGCWLVGKYPAPTFKGMTCGIAAVRSAIELALAQIHHKQEASLSSHCALQFDVQSGTKHTLLTLPGGEGAKATRNGISAQLNALSLEQLERDFPIKVLRVDQRHSNGGKGKFNGGRGVVMKIQICGDILATWMTDLTLHRPRLLKSCSHGDPAELTLEQGESAKTLPVLGQQKFTAKDVVTLCSGSGGGYGRAE